MVLLFGKGWQRWAGAAIAVLSLLAMINDHPFKSSRFTQFDGDQGVAPYQELITYANEIGAMTFWAHPESNREVHDLGIIKMQTRKYADDLLKSVGATGVETAYQDTIHITEPNRQWDTVLVQYLKGERAKPLWGLGGIDFHKDEPGQRINQVQTVLLVPTLSEATVLDALRRGRMYALRRGDDYQLILHTFTLNAGKASQPVQAGETLMLKEPSQIPQIDIIVAATKPRIPVTVDLIRSGTLLESFQGSTPLRILHRDEQLDTSQPAFYRIVVHGPGANYLVSNPIFVRPAASEQAPGSSARSTSKRAEVQP